MKLRKEYEAYMKLVCDTFVEMHSKIVINDDGIVNEHWFYNVLEWEEPKLYYVDGSVFVMELTKDGAKEHNRKTALAYLNYHSIDYDTWLKRYKANYDG